MDRVALWGLLKMHRKNRLLVLVLCFMIVAAALPALAVESPLTLIVIDGTPGPSVPINVAPPRPVNPLSAVENQAGYLIVNTDNLSLRTGPGAQYTLVGVLDGGTRLIVLGSNGQIGNPDQLWWFVEVGSLRGWVKNEFVIVRGNLSRVPTVTHEGTLIRPTLYVGINNWIYTQPSYSSPAICEITGNLLYYVVAIESALANWFAIEATCGGRMVTGWIAANRGILRNPANIRLPIGLPS